MNETVTPTIATMLHPVTDLPAAKALYTALLETAPMVDDEWYVGYQVGAQHIGLLPHGGPQRLTSPVAYWQVADIRAKVDELIAAGATVRDEISDVGGGRLVGTVTDRDGNVIGLAQDT